MEDYYKILGVPENASIDEIKKAFRELAKKYHPDRGGDPEQFKKILEAYRVLSDPKLRQEYDQKRKFAHTFTDFNFDFGFDDLFSNLQKTFFFDNLEDIFNDLFGSYSKKVFQKYIIKNLTISLQEAFQGTTKKITFTRLIRCFHCAGTGAKNKELTICQNCGGTGKIKDQKSFLSQILFTEVKNCPVCKGFGRIPKESCPNCQGKGLIDKSEEINIQIPAGLREKEIRIPGLGNQDKNGQTGDLIIKLIFQIEPPFSFENNNLIYHAKVNFLDAILGETIEIPLFNQKIKIKLPSGIMPGEIIKIPGKGLGGNPLYVKIHIIPPKKLTKRAKKLIDELRKEIE